MVKLEKRIMAIIGGGTLNVAAKMMTMIICNYRELDGLEATKRRRIYDGSEHRR
jgi:hypothetical protein